MLPTCYLFAPIENHHQLYLGGLSTLQGLKLFPPNTRCVIGHLYAEEDSDTDIDESQKAVRTIAGAIRLLKSLEPDSPHDFQCVFGRASSLGSHDDAECHIEVPHKVDAENLVRQIAPDEHADEIWTALTENLGAYITCDDEGAITVHSDFDAFLAAQDD